MNASCDDQEAPVIITDGQINIAVCEYLKNTAKNNRIPMIIDCSDTVNFSTLLDSGMLASCSWAFFNEESIQSFLTTVQEKTTLKLWTDIRKFWCWYYSL